MITRFTTCALVCLLLVHVRAFAGDGFLLPRRQALLPCQVILSEGDSPYRRGLLRRFGMYHVTDGERFGHHDFRLSLDDADGATEPIERQLLDLVHGESKWRRERWTTADGLGPYWFYEVGFRNLEEDAQNMNGLVAGVLLRSNAPYVKFTSSETRVRDLERLNTFRWACHDRVMRTYREHRNKQKYLGELDFEQFLAADRANLNVDVFAVTSRPLEWCTPRRAIQDDVISTIQISYDQPFGDFLRPSLDGLLAAHNEPPLAAPKLPFMERLAPEQKADFLAKFEQSYGHLSKCEITRYINRRTPKLVVQRLIREALERVHDRGCELVVATVDPHSLRLFGRYGFERDRRLPTAGSADESLAVLRVRSNAYARTITTLGDETRGVNSEDF